MPGKIPEKWRTIWHFSHPLSPLCRPLLSRWARASAFGALSICWRATARTTPAQMLMYGKEASNRKQEIDRQHHTIPNQRNQRPKDKHRGNVYNLLFRHGKVRSQNMEKLKCSFPTFCKQTFLQLHKTASYAHYAQCLRRRNSIHHLYLVKIAKNILIFIYGSYIMYSTLHFGTNI